MCTLHEVKDYAIGTLAIASGLHSVLPPWDWEPAFLEDFPVAHRAMKACVHNRWYKLIVTLLGYIGVNMRSTVWGGSISMPVQFEKMQNETEEQGVLHGV